MNAFLGEIRLSGSRILPKGWQRCLGQTLKIKDYDALYALIGTTYGGDGTTNFGLPDLRGRVPIGTGNAEGTIYKPGNKVGSAFVTLKISETPVHFHRLSVTDNVATTAIPIQAKSTFGSQPSDTTFYVDSSYGDLVSEVYFGKTSISESGNDVEHLNIMPSLGLYYMIAVTGIWPNN
ncbi:phage tail protein [Sphingomonas pokkalii]|uniref:Phage tail protein n=1 Tax=Sphingomonas pokkalii TaxID=2175090 RepID=A0A2U0SGB4_9SPHN|nr:tail fiber protein [Sphingomonas pokkalii]PVX30388.1 phage tail protein [Sphingomonas pokkalii]